METLKKLTKVSRPRPDTRLLNMKGEGVSSSHPFHLTFCSGAPQPIQIAFLPVLLIYIGIHACSHKICKRNILIKYFSVTKYFFLLLAEVFQWLGACSHLLAAFPYSCPTVKVSRLKLAISIMWIIIIFFTIVIITIVIILVGIIIMIAIQTIKSSSSSTSSSQIVNVHTPKRQA